MLEKMCYLVLTASALLMAYASLTGRLSRTTRLQPASRATVLSEGSVAPPLMLRAGEVDSVPAAMPGRETLVVFFSTACPYCLASLGTYRELARTRCDLALTFVVLDRQEAEVAGWWAENAWKEDNPDVCASVTVGVGTASIGAFGHPATPTHYLLDEEGRILRNQVGALLAIPDWLQREPSAERGTF